MRTPGFVVPSPGQSMDVVQRILRQQAEDYGFEKFDPEAFEDTEPIIRHFGVKGMKWGQRKASATSPASTDSARFTSVRKKAKTSGVHTLSNQELSDFITRANLERQYSSLNPSAVKKGWALVGDILKVSGTITSVSSLVKNTGGAIKKRTSAE